MALDEGEGELAEELAKVEGRRRAVETFGLGPPLVAALLVAYGVNALWSSSREGLDATSLAVLALIFRASAAGCVAYEVRRRRHTAVLVATKLHVGVYRRGRLCGVLTRADLHASRAPQFASVKGLLALGFVSIAFLAYGAGEEGGLASRILDMAPGVALGLLTLSSVWTVWLCQSFHLPGSRSKASFSTMGLERAGLLRSD